MLKFFLKFTATMTLLLVHLMSTAGQRDDDIAVVKVYKEIRGSQYVYTYEVTNRGTTPIISFSVGFDYYRGDSQLSGSLPSLIRSPQLWEGGVVALESSDRYEVSWDISLPGNGIVGGGTAAGFQIITDRDEPKFTNASWTVIIVGAPTRASSRLQFVQGPAPDTLPPVVSVILSPSTIWPPSKKMISITATVVATDNKDAQPVVRLLSIECNECNDPINDIADAAIGTNDRQFLLRADRVGRGKAGRIYTITYSATDNAGNIGIGSATVTIPHDRRK